MARILLAADDQRILENLRCSLERCSHGVTISPLPPAEILRQQAYDLNIPFDLLLIDVSCIDLSVLESFLKLRKRTEPVSGGRSIVGFSRRRQGPRFLLLLERAGIRYVRLA